MSQLVSQLVSQSVSESVSGFLLMGTISKLKTVQYLYNAHFFIYMIKVSSPTIASGLHVLPGYSRVGFMTNSSRILLDMGLFLEYLGPAGTAI